MEYCKILTLEPLKGTFLIDGVLTEVIEEFKDIPDFEGYYQVSDFGRVKSLECERFNGKAMYIKKGRILKPRLGSGYYSVNLCKGGKQKSYKISALVMMAFRDHVPCGFKVVVDHKDNNPLNDKLNNLQLISNRENSSKDKKGYSSKHVGVSWDKKKSKWLSSIRINRKSKFLGYFDNEIEASKAYQTKLREIS